MVRTWILAAGCVLALAACGAPSTSTALPTAESLAATGVAALPTAEAMMPTAEAMMPTAEAMMPTAEAMMPTAEAMMATAMADPTVAAAMATGVAAAPTGMAMAEDCSDVTVLDSASAEFQAISNEIETQSKAQGGDTVVLGSLPHVSVMGDWAIADAEYTAGMENGLFLLHKEGDTYKIVTVWGGITTEANQIQNYLMQQAPEAPAALINCFVPTSLFGNM